MLFPGFTPGGGGILSTPATPANQAGEVLACANPLTGATEWMGAATLRSGMGLGESESVTFGTVNAGGSVFNGDVIQQYDNGGDLGGASNRFTRGYFASQVIVPSISNPNGSMVVGQSDRSTFIRGGAIYLDPSGNLTDAIRVNVNAIQPYNGSTMHVGAVSDPFQDGHFSGTVNVGAVSLIDGRSITQPGVSDINFDSMHLHTGFGVWVRSTGVDRRTGIDAAAAGQDLELYANYNRQALLNASGFSVFQTDGTTLGTLNTAKVQGSNSVSIKPTNTDRITFYDGFAKLGSSVSLIWGNAPNSGQGGLLAGLIPMADNTIRLAVGPTSPLGTFQVGTLALNATDTITAASAGTTEFASPYANTVKITSGQSGQSSGFELITAEGKKASIKHYDVVHAKGRLLEISTQPATAISFMPGGVDSLSLNPTTGDAAFAASLGWDGNESQRLNGDAWQSYESSLTSWQTGIAQQASPAGIKLGFFGMPAALRPQVTAGGVTAAQLLTALDSIGLLKAI